MTTLTIPRQLASQGELIVISRGEYDELIKFRKMLEIIQPTVAEKKTIERGRKEYAEGKYVTLAQLKHELGFNSSLWTH